MNSGACCVETAHLSGSVPSHNILADAVTVKPVTPPYHAVLCRTILNSRGNEISMAKKRAADKDEKQRKKAKIGAFLQFSFSRYKLFVSAM